MESVISSLLTIVIPGGNIHDSFPFRHLNQRIYAHGVVSCSRNKGFISISCCSSYQNADSKNDTNYPPASKPEAIPHKTHNFTTLNSQNSTPFYRGQILSVGPAGSWDSQTVGSPVVKRFIRDEEERWYMWYHGHAGDKRNSIGLAISSNGIHWERGFGKAESSGDAGLVMECGSDWWGFDTLSISPGEVVVMSSSKVRGSSAVYWLYYTGFSLEESGIGNLEDKSAKIFKSLPGLAISQDARHWARIEGEHHSGALFDAGSEGDWDALFVANPQVVVHEIGDLRMYYHSMNEQTGEFEIGVARSRDGMKWLKLGKILEAGKSGCFDELGVMNAFVVKLKSMYLMAYEGVGADGRRSIGLAMSSDGLRNWSRVSCEAVLKPSDGERWDNKEVGSPCLVQMDGDVDDWRLYYRGIGRDGGTGIGMATASAGAVRSFKRWTGFHP